MNIRIQVFRLLLFILFPTTLIAQNLHSEYQKKEFIKDGDTLRYNILYPIKYKSSERYPVITLLHGSGERGSDNAVQLNLGGSFFWDAINKDNLQAIIIFPQCPDGKSWREITETPAENKDSVSIINADFRKNPTKPTVLVKQLLDSLVTSNIADPERIYIGGISLGGFGTFDMIERYPEFFAAAFPICGGGDTTKAYLIAPAVGVWIFHGGSDMSVNVDLSRQYYKELKKLEGDVKYTEYKGVGHNSWDYVFQEKDLLPWLMSKRRN